MKTICTTVYSFSELSEEAKQKALENLYDLNVDYEWWDGVYEDAKNAGLSISAFDIDRGSYCKGELTTSALASATEILKNHGESCDTWKMAFDFVTERNRLEKLFQHYDQMSYLYEYINEHKGIDVQDRYDHWKELFYPIEEEIEEMEKEYENDLCGEYLSMLRKEYEYLTSEAAIIETIEANEYTFTKNGKLMNA